MPVITTNLKTGDKVRKLAVVASEAKLRPSPAFLQDMSGLVAKFEATMLNDEGRSARNYATIARILLGCYRLPRWKMRRRPFGAWQFVTDKICPQIRGMQQHAGVTGVHVTPQTSANWLSQVFQTLDRLEILQMVNPCIQPRNAHCETVMQRLWPSTVRAFRTS
ncbi:uncharacterized protein LOC144875264 isoform X2 [Branchiostoma floridae x Branchiostoma japonicum]